jgi:hypothetical protein
LIIIEGNIEQRFKIILKYVEIICKLDELIQFGFKVLVVVVAAQNMQILRTFIEFVPAIDVNRDEQFEFLNMFSFRMYVSKSLIICIDL